MKQSVYREVFKELKETLLEEPSWPITFVLKDGTRLESLVSELGEPDKEYLAIFVENEPHRGTAYFEIEDIICILS